MVLLIQMVHHSYVLLASMMLLVEWMASNLALNFLSGLSLVIETVLWSLRAHRKVQYWEQKRWMVGQLDCSSVLMISMASWMVALKVLLILKASHWHAMLASLMLRVDWMACCLA